MSRTTCLNESKKDLPALNGRCARESRSVVIMDEHKRVTSEFAGCRIELAESMGIIGRVCSLSKGFFGICDLSR